MDISFRQPDIRLTPHHKKRKTVDADQHQDAKWHPRYRGRRERRVLLESSDGCLFEVEWRVLTSHSTVFQDMGEVATESDEPISMDLESRNLATLLDLLYQPVELTTADKIDTSDFSAIANAIYKYEFRLLNKLVDARMDVLLIKGPLEAFRFASSINRRDFAVQAIAAMRDLFELFPTIDLLFEQLVGIRPEWQVEFIRLLLNARGKQSTKPWWTRYARLDGAAFCPEARLQRPDETPASSLAQQDDHDELDLFSPPPRVFDLPSLSDLSD